MDSALSLAQNLSPPGKKTSVAGETSRCSRCVRDKQGCDRRLPCGRCIKADIPDECFYTGTISEAHQRTTPIVPSKRQSMRSGSARKASARFAEDDLELDDEDALPLTPGSARSRKSAKKGRSRSRHVVRRRRSMMAQPSTNEESYREPLPDVVETAVDLVVEPEKSEDEIMRWEIFGSYTDIVTHLPIELYRSTTFIKSLDKSYLRKTEQLDDLCRELQHCADLPRTLILRQEICRLARESREDRAESVAEVAKLQSLVEAHINTLSAEIEKIERPPSARRVTEAVADPLPKKQSVAWKRSQKNESANDGFDVPIEDGEPVYCYCQRVSFGKMIACENEQCEGGEWFHFGCLGITNAPRGKWWCKSCTKAGLATGKSSKTYQEEVVSSAQGRVRGESKAEKTARVREENRLRETARRAKLKSRRQLR